MRLEMTQVKTPGITNTCTHTQQRQRETKPGIKPPSEFTLGGVVEAATAAECDDWISRGRRRYPVPVPVSVPVAAERIVAVGAEDVVGGRRGAKPPEIGLGLALGTDTECGAGKNARSS